MSRPPDRSAAFWTGRRPRSNTSVRPTPTNWRSPCSPRCKAAHCSPTPYATQTSCRAKCSASSGGSTPSPHRAPTLQCRRRSESGAIPPELEPAIANTWAVGSQGPAIIADGKSPATTSTSPSPLSRSASRIVLAGTVSREPSASAPRAYSSKKQQATLDPLEALKSIDATRIGPHRRNAAIRETNPGATAVRHPANAHVNEARYEGESENLQVAYGDLSATRPTPRHVSGPAFPRVAADR